MRIDHDALVMVMDGGKMLLFRNEGDAAYPHLLVEAAQENANPADQEQRTDTQGRAFASVGSARSALGETDFHELQESRFVADAVDLLNRRALANAYERLIIVAPPTVLGDNAQALQQGAGARLIGEIAQGPDRPSDPPDDRARDQRLRKRRRLISTFRSLFVLLWGGHGQTETPLRLPSLRDGLAALAGAVRGLQRVEQPR